ncbi:MAG: hypothetical protein KA152_04935 [Verrucomicrobiales bacterium]|nr:hypothetical protein [Verrucomicrobiales bacterium]
MKQGFRVMHQWHNGTLRHGADFPQQPELRQRYPEVLSSGAADEKKATLRAWMV